MKRVIVRQEMKRRGLTYKDLAAVAECSVDAIRKFIAQKRFRNWSRVIKICEYLGVATDEYCVDDCNTQVTDLIDYANSKGCRVRFEPCVKPTFMGIDKRDDVPQLWIACKADNSTRLYSLIALITEAARRQWIELPSDELEKLQIATGFLRPRTQEKQSLGIVDVCAGYEQDDCFAVCVDDNGFAPDIISGDKIIIHKQSTVENGDIAAVSVDGDINTVLRRVHYSEHGLTLTADNGMGKRFEPITIEADKLDRVHIFGKVVSRIRYYNKGMGNKIDLHNYPTAADMVRSKAEENTKSIDGILHFTRKEVAKMPKSFSKQFRFDGCTARVRKSMDERYNTTYEILYRRYGYNIAVLAPTLEEAKQKFIENIAKGVTE